MPLRVRRSSRVDRRRALTPESSRSTLGWDPAHPRRMFSSLWLLNGSSNRLLFSVGVVCARLAPVLFAYLMLAHPPGTSSRGVEQRFPAVHRRHHGVALVARDRDDRTTSAEDAAPPVRASLSAERILAGHCHRAVGVVKAAIVVAWLALANSTPILLARRARLGPAPVWRSLTPLTATAVAIPPCFSRTSRQGRRVGRRRRRSVPSTSGARCRTSRILEGLGRERLFMGQMLADFVDELARVPNADPEALMAAVLRDPSLRIAYRSRGETRTSMAAGEPPVAFRTTRQCPGSSGTVAPSRPSSTTRDIANYERFVHAAGAAAVIRWRRCSSRQISRRRRPTSPPPGFA